MTSGGGKPNTKGRASITPTPLLPIASDGEVGAWRGWVISGGNGRKGRRQVGGDFEGRNREKRTERREVTSEG